MEKVDFKVVIFILIKMQNLKGVLFDNKESCYIINIYNNGGKIHG